MAFLNRGLTIVLRDERPNASEASAHDEIAEAHDEAPTEVVYRYDGGLVDYVNFLGSRKDPVHRTVVSFEAESEYIDGGLSLDVAMQWNSGFTESVHTFANTINTHEGGTHEEGFRAALTTLVNKFARDWNIIKEKDTNLTGDDVREGLTAIVSVKLADPQFEGQTKTKLGNTEAKSFVQKVVNDRLGEWFEKNPSEGKDIARKAMSASVARLAARKARDAARSRKGLLGGGSLPGKLADCQSTNPEECELFIVEGDSAGGPAKQGRDQRTQAILPIRGKILNVERARLDRVLGNQEVQAIISALGTGIQGDEFDLARLRYHKVVLMADADVDGQHIRTLLLTLLFRFMPEVVEHGHVYLAQPPLYKLKWARPAEPEYAYSDRERDALIAAGVADGKKLLKDDGVQRYKGLGEMNNDELWDTTMDPQKRILLQVTLENAALADALFTELMGEDVEPRRKFIQRNAKDVRFLDI
jgi:DNA gyrase subunit B